MDNPGSKLSLVGLLRLEFVDDGCFELAGRDFALEEDIQFSVGTVLKEIATTVSIRPISMAKFSTYFRLGKTEPRPDETTDSQSRPEVSALRSPIPVSWVQHKRVNHCDNDAPNIVPA